MKKTNNSPPTPLVQQALDLHEKYEKNQDAYSDQQQSVIASQVRHIEKSPTLEILERRCIEFYERFKGVIK